jgi:hypothetical protein
MVEITTDRLRTLQRELMPRFMLDYEKRRLEQPLPNADLMRKHEYIEECFRLFSPSLVDDRLNSEPRMKGYSYLVSDYRFYAHRVVNE